MGLQEERAVARGQLEALKQQQKKMRMGLEKACADVRAGLNTVIVPVDDLNIPVVAEKMDAIQEDWAELAVVNSQIDRLERELA